MRYNSVLAAATSLIGLAPSAAAFLITPEMMPTTKDGVSIVEVVPEQHQIHPECDSCPFWQEGDDVQAEVVPRPAKRGKLNFNFFVRENQLWINNAPVFPLGAVIEEYPSILSHVSLQRGLQSVEVPVDFALEAQKIRLGNDDDELIIVDFTALGLAGRTANAQSVQLKLIQTQGQLFLVDSQLMPFDPLKTEAEMCDNARNQRLCRLRAAIHDRIRQMMEAASKHTSNIKDWMKTHAPGNKPRPCPGAMRAHGDRYGNPHRNGGPHHHRGFKPAHWLFVVVKTFLIPAALGVAAGIGVSLIGMVVGRLVSMLWIYVVRGGRQGNVDNLRTIEVQIEEGEKTGLMEVIEEDSPPAYADEIVIVEQEKQ